MALSPAAVSKLSVVGLFYCSAIWGATFYMVKDALDAVDPLAMVAWRFLIAAAVMLPWVPSRLRKPQRLREAAVLSAILAVLYVAQTIGLRYTTAANSGFITGLFVIFVPLFMLVFFKRQPTAGHWAASALACAGLWLLTGGVSEFNRGDAVTLLAAVTYAAHVLLTDVYVRADADPVLLAFHQFWMIAAACFILAGGSGVSLAVATPEAWKTIVFLAVFPTVTGFYIQLVGQKHTAPVKAALIFSLEPVFAALFAWTVGGEAFVPARAGGGALIVAAMVLGELTKLELFRGRRKEIVPA